MSDPRITELRHILATHDDNELQGNIDFDYVIQHLAACTEEDIVVDDLFTDEGVLCPCCGRVL